MQRKKAAERISIFRRIRSALAFRCKNTLSLLKKYKRTFSDDSLSIIQDCEAKYAGGRQMPEIEAIRLAKKALCPLTYVEQVLKNHNMDRDIIRAFMNVHKQAKGSGVAVIAAAKAAVSAASGSGVNKIDKIESTLKSISHIAHFVKSADVAAECAKTASFYEGDDAVNIASALFNVILPFNYKEYPQEIKNIPLRASEFLRDKEVMNMVKDSPFILEIASYICSKPALAECIKLNKFFIPLPHMPIYIQLGISKVARATRSGDEVVRWINIIKNHITNGDVNARLMILLLCQFGVQAGDATPVYIDSIGVRDAAVSGKKILGEGHATFFREFADCIL
jgi:hypothetical protein